ncbi:MAG: ribosomal L7Ae/L30e/S12e/Gadd45 family protein [Dethiobacter sp.]|nr:ribosomal L7Ae/L30e/S12e/Gadd45 family protein [Dethiobacter sp.]MCL5982411.1 ribosomal L7Ae/L30e/S12e/Gadd45 family protein [Bacillota bacterium]
MDLECQRQARLVVTGMKQTIKAVLSGHARQVYVARDADERVQRPVLEACVKMSVPVSFVDYMADLGKACGIKVGAATAAVLLEQ